MNCLFIVYILLTANNENLRNYAVLRMRIIRAAEATKHALGREIVLSAVLETHQMTF